MIVIRVIIVIVKKNEKKLTEIESQLHIMNNIKSLVYDG